MAPSLQARRTSITAGPPAREAAKTRSPRPRWFLHMQAVFWRTLMGIGMLMHRLAPPRPAKPAFSITVPTTIAPKQGTITLQFYVPRDYKVERQRKRRKYPLVVNFHGGGFTIGNATDDARWCEMCVHEVGAVVVSVDYRLAPEHPFPTAVEDGVDALMYLVSNAAEYNLDINKIAVSGFSSGANMAFTVPLRLQEELADESGEPPTVDQTDGGAQSTDHLNTRPIPRKALSEGRILIKSKKEISVKCVVSWYPSTDYTHTREQRRATCSRLDHQLPAVFTNLFDDSYLQPPTLDMAHPYLSPGVAPTEMLAGLPQEIIMFTCEWDMLLAEGERFRDRLTTELGKTVHYTMVPEVPHGWDKAPNPLRETPGVKAWYMKACKEMKRLLQEEKEASITDIRRASTVIDRARQKRRSSTENKTGDEYILKSPKLAARNVKLPPLIDEEDGRPLIMVNSPDSMV